MQIIKAIYTWFSNTDQKKERPAQNFKSREIASSPLEKGAIAVINAPDLGGRKEMILTQWHFKVGDIVMPGDIICELETDKVIMEVESFSDGEIIWCCEKKKRLKVDMAVCKIKGI